MTATYTKLRSGEWGVRVDGAVKEGQTVTVTKKGGDTKQETITKVLWTDGKISLCAIGTKTPSYRPQAGSLRGRRTGCSCGSIEGVYRDSDCWTCRHDNE